MDQKAQGYNADKTSGECFDNKDQGAQDHEKSETSSDDEQQFLNKKQGRMVRQNGI